MKGTRSQLHSLLEQLNYKDLRRSIPPGTWLSGIDTLKYLLFYHCHMAITPSYFNRIRFHRVALGGCDSHKFANLKPDTELYRLQHSLFKVYALVLIYLSRTSQDSQGGHNGERTERKWKLCAKKFDRC